MRSLPSTLTLLVLCAAPGVVAAQPARHGRCSQGSRAACVARAVEHADRGDRAAAYDYYDRACRLHSVEGCFQVARYAANGVGRSRDYALARRIYGDLCEEGVAAACNNLGVMYRRGVGLPPDAARAIRLFTRACREDDAVACRNAGTMYRDAEGVRRSLPMARRHFRRACATRDGLACFYLGETFERGGGAAGLRRARDLYQTACEEGVRAGCHALAMLYAEGRGTEPNLDAAVRLLDEQCERRYAPSCRAASSLRCEVGDPAGCLELGRRQLAEARESSAPVEVAREAFERSCAGGLPEGCHALGRLLARDLNEPEAARAHLETACEGGVAAACSDLGRAEPEAAAPEETSEAATEAERLYAEGEEACRAGRFGEALDAYERSHRLDPDPEALRGIGRAAAGLGWNGRAVEALSEYLRLRPEAADRASVEARIAELGGPVDETAPVPEQATVSRAAPGARRPRGASHRTETVVPLIRTGLAGGGILFGDRSSVGGSFVADLEVGVRLMLHAESGLSLDPAVGALLHAGDETVFALQAGADLGLERGFVFVSYGGRYLVGTLGDVLAQGLRHSLFVELGGFLGVRLAHDILFGEQRADALHGLSLALTVDVGVLLWAP